MAEQTGFGETAVGRLIARAWRALAESRPAPAPASEARRNGPRRTSYIHPPGSCARDWRAVELSDLFAPEAPDEREKRR